jgi:hypothetical protein
MPLHFMGRRQMIKVTARSASLIVVHPIIKLSRAVAAQDVPTVPAPDGPLDLLTKRTAAARLLAEMGPNTPIDTKVARLIDRLVLRDRDQVQAAVTALTMLGQPAVPAIIRRMDDRRDMPVGAVSFENRSINAFEGVRHLGVGKVVDGLNLVLSDITGEWFGVVAEPQPDRPEFGAQRNAIVAGWRGYLARKRAMPRAPGKSPALAEPTQPRRGNGRNG